MHMEPFIEKQQRPKELARTRSLYTILTKNNKFVQKSQGKRKEVQAFRGVELWESKYMGKLMDSKGCLVRFVVQIPLSAISGLIRVQSHLWCRQIEEEQSRDIFLSLLFFNCLQIKIPSAKVVHFRVVYSDRSVNYNLPNIVFHTCFILTLPSLFLSIQVPPILQFLIFLNQHDFY